MGDSRSGGYFEEMPRAGRPIEPVGTAIAAFVGVAGSGPARGTFVSSRSDYADLWPDDSALARCVADFFDNGGSAVWIAPVSRLTPSGVRRAVTTMDRDVTLVAIASDPAAPADVVAAAADASTVRRAMLLVEGRWGSAAEAIEQMGVDRTGALGASGANVVAYWPRIHGPSTADASPLGAIAGMIARTDAARGIFAAPAGTDAVLAGGMEPTLTATRAELEALNELGVNVIRRFTGTGTVVWGARTQSADVEWTYVPVRRLFLFIEESIGRGLAWVVFEPNGEPLWREVQRSVLEFLMGLFGQGAFAGRKPEHAFFARCDRTTMTQDDVDRGRVVCQIGIAPARPSEFVTFRIGLQTADGGGGQGLRPTDVT